MAVRSDESQKIGNVGNFLFLLFKNFQRAPVFVERGCLSHGTMASTSLLCVNTDNSLFVHSEMHQLLITEEWGMVRVFTSPATSGLDTLPEIWDGAPATKTFGQMFSCENATEMNNFHYFV